MTKYVGQTASGELETLPGEHPDPNLLFSERDRKDAYALIVGKGTVGALRAEKTKAEVVEHLREVDRANDSFQARFIIDQLTSESGTQ